MHFFHEVLLKGGAVARAHAKLRAGGERAGWPAGTGVKGSRRA
jgi:hypothetical protein